MKKVISIILSVVGVIVVSAMIYLVGHYGSVNMGRAYESCVHWRTTGEFI